VSFYRRRLPHWQPEGPAIFLTWRLFGSLPKYKQTEPAASLTEGQRFLALDREMDRASSGPTWLKQPSVAARVADTLLLAEQQWELYKMFAWVVMSNHVHVLLRPNKKLSDVTRAIKKTSATQANLILGRTGQPFWQEESYDHWVRDRREFDGIVRYIEWNPVRAGLVERAEDWPWSSASTRPFSRQVGNLPYG
jgi:putative transposase